MDQPAAKLQEVMDQLGVPRMFRDRGELPSIAPAGARWERSVNARGVNPRKLGDEVL